MKKKIKSIASIILTAIMVLSLVACAKSSQQKEVEPQQTAPTENKVETQENTVTQEGTQYPYTFTDSNGQQITIEKEPQRIISVNPSITEIIYALGIGDKLVARTDYCDYPEQVSQVESIGSLIEPNIEKIIELQPDVVIASAHFQEDVSKKLADLGIHVIVLYDAQHVEGAYDLIDTLGIIVNAQDQAKEIVSTMKTRIENVQEKIKGKKAPTVYYVVDFGKNGDYTATGDTFVGEILDTAGGDNIAKNDTGWGYSLEKIIENDPEYIIIPKNYGMKDRFVVEAGYKDLSAVKNNKIIEVDDNLFSRQGPRLAEGIEILAKALHPDLFQ